MKALYTVSMLSATFSRGTDTIYLWLKDGVFPHAFKVKGGWYVPHKDVHRLMTHLPSLPGTEKRPNCTQKIRENANDLTKTREKSPVIARDLP
jgi:hypothetical protein